MKDMNKQIGDRVVFKKQLADGKHYEMEGIVYGYIPKDKGGAKWLVKEVKFKDNQIIGVRKVE